MSGMLELGSSRCLNLTAEFKFVIRKKQIQTVKMAVCSHLNFSSNFGGFSRLFYPHGAFLSEFKTPPGVPAECPWPDSQVVAPF
jgi:hypothetical protein